MEKSECRAVLLADRDTCCAAREMDVGQVADYKFMKVLMVCLLVAVSLAAGCSPHKTKDSIVGLWAEAGTATLIEIKADGAIAIVASRALLPFL